MRPEGLPGTMPDTYIEHCVDCDYRDSCEHSKQYTDFVNYVCKMIYAVDPIIVDIATVSLGCKMYSEWRHYGRKSEG